VRLKEFGDSTVHPIKLALTRSGEHWSCHSIPRRGVGSGEAEVADERLIIVAVPPLVSTLLHRESQKGAPLNEKEVLAIRDSAACVTVPYGVATKMAEQRGYADIRLEHAWEDWNAIRPILKVQSS
jgi:hypothetical protein